MIEKAQCSVFVGTFFRDVFGNIQPFLANFGGARAILIALENSSKPLTKYGFVFQKPGLAHDQKLEISRNKNWNEFSRNWPEILPRKLEFWKNLDEFSKICQ